MHSRYGTLLSELLTTDAAQSEGSVK